ncbi:RNA polymerase II C-terminal domain phosphatase-like [Musa troglodytarum]|uniref:protein-serine/threonine phosphatase n=1 Tax=Musa troglodytarum TaxID=320322 RepID=A0A9E7I4Q9_9LILI|nr:RNA polymerase II C-terminal domain phosphatase-like [Musa troglodytarum]
MRVSGSNRFFLNPSEKETLARMATDCSCGGRAADGETSDGDSSQSLEEISAEDFKQEARAGRSRVFVGYPMSKNYAPSLYSFAWAQAVRNKPLGLDLMPMRAGDLAVKNDSGVKPEKEEVCDVIIEDSSQEDDSAMEKEEGELEEGEVDFGSEPMMVDEATDVSSDKHENEPEKKESDGEESQGFEDFDRRVSLILEELETITMEEAEASFEGVCARLRKSFEDLKPMFTGIESSDTVLHVVVQQAVMGIQTTYSALDSFTMQKKEQNKQLLLRLLIHIKNQYYTLLTPEQVREIDTLVNSLVFEEDHDKEKEQHGGGLVCLETPSIASKTVNLPNLEFPTPSRNRVEFSPLLDLHADYDADSLPSPTRENLPQFSIPKPIGLGMLPVVSSQPRTAKNEEAEEATSHPYVTDALKAVSCYQQRYGSTSFLSINRLPSPTPSEEGDRDDDSHEEASSSSVVSNAETACTIQNQAVKSSSTAACSNSSAGDQPNPVKLVGQVGSGSKSSAKPALKRRDPRLKLMNNEVRGPSVGDKGIDSNAFDNRLVGRTMSTRKHNSVDEPVTGDHKMKRQKNGFTESRDMQMTSGRGGWLEDSSIPQPSDRNRIHENFWVEVRKPGSGEVGSGKKSDSNVNFSMLNGLIPNPLGNLPNTLSLPPLLKAVNPTIFVQLLQMEQHRLAAENHQIVTASTSDVTNVSKVNGLPGAVSSVNSTPLKSQEVGQNHLGMSQIPSQSASVSSQNDVGRIRMKPRDPRRALHNNMVQTKNVIVSEQKKINGAIPGPQSSMGHSTAREPGEQAQASVLATQFVPQPNMSRQLTKNLGNIVSSSQLAATSQAVPQYIPSKANQVNVRPSSAELNDLKTVVSEATAKGVSQSINPWGDVDHFLDGYNDEQRAAIQKERARRIAEQNKMFAARKLCLVLDLDHTLLNSAKFVEVDPVHEEILRRKEEQDREKPQRHLFRFHHMGMWTKLRPGIWNFLEKASKLYELHLYTMGNKLYATEMAKVLDPTGTLFSGRVISRGDDADTVDGEERVPKSKDLDGVLGMESAVVIIDDSLRVWPLNKLNLIVVERYTYFPSSRRQFGLLGPSLLEIDHDERPEDGTLASSLAVIERIHQNFFSHHSLKDVDVRNILAAEQRKILAGCRIVFSRVFPVGEANPHLHPLWQTAEQFGAVCTNQIDEQVTHVVANSLGTDKVNWALSTGRFVVHPGWVEASALLYRRANEHDFAASWRKKKITSATGANTDIKASRELLPKHGPPYSHTQLQRTARHLRRDTRQEPVVDCTLSHRVRRRLRLFSRAKLLWGAILLGVTGFASFFLVYAMLSPSNSTNFVHTISAFSDPNRGILVIQIYMGKRVAWEASSSSLYSRRRKRAAPTDKRRPSRY